MKKNNSLKCENFSLQIVNYIKFNVYHAEGVDGFLKLSFQGSHIPSSQFLDTFSFKNEMTMNVKRIVRHQGYPVISNLTLTIYLQQIFPTLKFLIQSTCLFVSFSTLFRKWINDPQTTWTAEVRDQSFKLYFIIDFEGK